MYAPPTREELADLRETQTLFKSNLFKLQLTEFLSEVVVDYTKQGILENALREIKAICEKMPSIPEKLVRGGDNAVVAFCCCCYENH